MRHEAAGSVRISRALQAAAEELGINSAAREAVARRWQLQRAASRKTSETIALRMVAREVALHVGHGRDVGEVDLLNSVVHRDLLLVCRQCHDADLGSHLAFVGEVDLLNGMACRDVLLVRCWQVPRC